MLEARDRVGGRVHSYHQGGFTVPVDLGASTSWPGSPRTAPAAILVLAECGGCRPTLPARHASLTRCPAVPAVPCRRQHHHRHRGRHREGAALRPLCSHLQVSAVLASCCAGAGRCSNTVWCYDELTVPTFFYLFDCSAGSWAFGCTSLGSSCHCWTPPLGSWCLLSWTPLWRSEWGTERGSSAHVLFGVYWSGDGWQTAAKTAAKLAPVHCAWLPLCFLFFFLLTFLLQAAG